MHLTGRNVNDVFYQLVSGIHAGTIPTEVMASRYGEVAAVEEPVIITYEKPLECVLFNPYRDANPFFHLYEALWMLAGRDDVEPLAYYASRMREFSDDGETFNGAYGYRWRHSTIPGYRQEPGIPNIPEDIDQLTIIIDHLCRKPESRRAVLQMWTVEDDLLKIDTSKDCACNLSVLFAVEQGPCRACNGTGKVSMEQDYYDAGTPCNTCGGKPHEQPRFLNMTVFNRSNDIVWGTCGSDHVTFVVLQEYVACCLGLEVGKYHQVSNNAHVYTVNWKPEEWLKYDETNRLDTPYMRASTFPYRRVPLVRDQATFDRECAEFVERHQRDAMAAEYTEPFLLHVAQPMCVAFHHYKRGDLPEALVAAKGVVADDWRTAVVQWLERRVQRRAAKEVKS